MNTYYMKVEFEDKWAIYKYDLDDNLIKVLEANVPMTPKSQEYHSFELGPFNKSYYRFTILTEADAMLELL